MQSITQSGVTLPHLHLATLSTRALLVAMLYLVAVILLTLVLFTAKTHEPLLTATCLDENREACIQAATVLL